MPAKIESFDLIVLGAGAGGLAAANRAVDLGARVLVLEKADAIGGSAAMSAGILWTAPDEDVLWRVQPDADPELGPAVVAGYDQAVQDVRDAGVEVSEPWHDHLEWGTARKIDIPALFSQWSQKIEKTGGQLLTSISDAEFITEGKSVIGVSYEHQGQRHTAHAGSTVLATGGFQGDSELKAKFIGSGAEDIAVRSNPNSTGDGFRLGQEAGAAASRHLSGFYGHTLPSPLDVTPQQFLRLTHYFSAYGVLVNRQGRRFTDESLGDEVSNQFLVKQSGHRGVLIWNEQTQQEKALAVPYPSGMALNRHAEATEAGARTAKTETLDELLDIIGTWGVDRTGAARTVRNYRKASAGDAVALDAPLPAKPSPLENGPYYAVELQPCITIPFGGLRTDVDGRVLDRNAQPVPGLFAVGADAGGAQDLRYVGGIVFGFVFGRRAAEAAMASSDKLTRIG